MKVLIADDDKPPPPPSREGVMPATILIVEDNPITRKMARIALSNEGRVVLEAGDGASALDLAARSGPDLILQDLLLPDMDGFDLVRRLRELPACREIPILAFSGFRSRLEGGKGASAGFTDFLIKPVAPSDLVKSVESYLAISAPKTARRGRRVLLVDDDVIQLKIARLRLEGAGFDVVTAADGVEGLEVARREPFDVIVTDVLMPRLDGFGLCLSIRQDPTLARLPIVITTNTYLEDADLHLGREIGANAFVPRTPGFDGVIAAVLISLDEEAPAAKPLPGYLREKHVHRMVSQLERQAVINAGLSQRCSAQAAALSILGTTADALARSLDPDRVFQEVLTDCLEAGGCSVGILYLVGERGQLALRAQIGCDGLTPSEIEGFFGHEELFRRVIETGEPVAVPSVAVEAETARDFVARVGPASVMLSPLTFKDQHIGVLIIGSDQQDLTSAERLDFAQALGLQIGQAIALSRAFAEAQSHVHEADVLADLVGKINESLDLETILQRVADGARELVRADRTVIALREPASSAMAVRYLAGADPITYAGARIEAGKGSGGLVLLTGRAFRTDDYAEDPRITKDYLLAATAHGVRAQVVVPIRIGDQIEGLLFAQRSASRSFTERDETILQRLADHAAIAVRNSQHFAREREMRRAVEVSEENFRRLFSNGPLPMWVFDVETLRFLEVNDATVAQYGYSRDEFLAMKISDLQTPESHALLPDDLAGVHRGSDSGLRIVGERRHRCKDGRLIDVEVTAHDFEAAGRTVSLVLGQDITARRRAEAQRDALAERYRSLVERLPVGLFRTLANGGIVDANPALVQILRYPDQETLLAVNARDFYVNPEERERLETALQSQGILRDFETQVRAWDGTVLWTLVNARSVDEGDGRMFYEGTIQDISERKRAEGEKAALEEQLRQTQKMEAIGSLAGGIAHDFNNLLTVITGRSQLLLRRLTTDARAQRDVELIAKTADRAAGLTRQLLVFSRNQVLQPRLLGLNGVVNEVIEMLQRTIGEDIDLSFAPEAMLGFVCADPGQVEQVLLNLAVNARDAMPTGGRLTIETANVHLDETYVRSYEDLPAGPYVMIAVSDTGIGMDAPTRARVFEPFFTTKPAGKGTGLGLATAYGIVKQSGGHIRLYSELGVGTTFKVYLPRVASPGETLPPVQSGTDALGGTETVLLVEDEDEVRALTQEVLEGQGYRVLVAGHPTEAIALAATWEMAIDLLVTDVVMPSLGGRDLAERLVSARPGMKVLYISGYTDDAVVRHGVLNQSVAFVQKPFTPQALARKVREVLDSAKGN